MGELVMFPGVSPDWDEPEPEEEQDWDEWRDEQVAQFNADATDLEGADPDTFFEVATALVLRIQSWSRG